MGSQGNRGSGGWGRPGTIPHGRFSCEFVAGFWLEIRVMFSEDAYLKFRSSRFAVVKSQTLQNGEARK